MKWRAASAWLFGKAINGVRWVATSAQTPIAARTIAADMANGADQVRPAGAKKARQGQEDAREGVPTVEIYAEHLLRGGGVARGKVRVGDQPGDAPGQPSEGNHQDCHLRRRPR